MQFCQIIFDSVWSDVTFLKFSSSCSKSTVYYTSRNKHKTQNMKFKTACGYWFTCRTIFIALERAKGCIMMVEGSVVGGLSHKQTRKPATSHRLTSTLLCEKRWFKNVMTNWHSTNNLMVTNNQINNNDSNDCYSNSNSNL